MSLDHLPPARFIVAIWGRPYLDNFLDFTLPAILSRGNLPAIARAYQTTFVLLTEAHFRQELLEHPAIRDLCEICAFELREIDDLVADRNMYGMSLTYALHRGFADLGLSMCDTALFFINGDFVLADGAGKQLVAALGAGHRAILAPSYCVATESIRQELGALKDGERLTIAPREMAGLALAHRHDTVVARTVNDDRFHIPVADQFYWSIGDRALLGRQFPVAMLAMKPEVAYLEPVGFWDYAALPKACPGGDWKVVGDSDDIAILELSERSYALGDLEAGPVDPDRAAAVLCAIATEGHRALGRRSLVLHDEDLGPEHEQGAAVLGEFVEAVYARFPTAPAPVDAHPLWVARKPHFERLSRVPRVDADDTVILGRRPMSRWVGSREIYRLLFGRVPRVRPWHPLRAVYRASVEVLDRLPLGPGSNVLSVASQEPAIARIFVEKACKIQVTSAYQWEDGRVEEPEIRYDACVLELSRRELQRLPGVLRPIRRLMKPGAAIVVSHVDWQGRLRNAAVDIEAVAGVLESGDEMEWGALNNPALARLVQSYAEGLDRARTQLVFPRPLATMATMLALIPQTLIVGGTSPVKLDAAPIGAVFAVCGIVRVSRNRPGSGVG